MESEWRPITHTCQLVAGEFFNQLGALGSFCTLAYQNLEVKIADAEQRQAEARKRDADEFGKHEGPSPYTDGEEMDIAFEHHSLWEAKELVGCFALVHLVSSLEQYSDALLKDTNLLKSRRDQKKEANRQRKKRDQHKFLVTLQILEERLNKNVPDGVTALIKEIVYARNDFVHHNGWARTARRFVKENKVALTKEELAEALSRLRVLCDFLEKECKPLSRGLGSDPAFDEEVVEDT